MFITVQFPVEATFLSTNQWYLDPVDKWTVKQLTADVLYAARLTDHHLELNGQPLASARLSMVVLSEDDTVVLVPD